MLSDRRLQATGLQVGRVLDLHQHLFLLSVIVFKLLGWWVGGERRLQTGEARCLDWVIRYRGDPAASPAMSAVTPKADQVPHRSEPTLSANRRHPPIPDHPSGDHSMALTCRWRSRPQHHERTSWASDTTRDSPGRRRVSSYCYPGPASFLQKVGRASLERRLAAVLIADFVGYRRLTQADEEGTRARFHADLRDIFEPKIADASWAHRQDHG